jgi:hypothetical protein
MDWMFLRIKYCGVCKMNIQLSTKYDKNGNRVLVCKVGTKRAFRVQTNGNLPIAHNCDNSTLANCAFNRGRVIGELKAYVDQYGTKKQKEALL